MKAIQYNTFGDSGVLKPVQVNQPAYKEDEMLVKVIATTVNPLDIKVRSGAMQKFMPIHFPYTPGSDLAGIVEAVGSKVTKFKPGDAVFGSASGTYAEYAAMPESKAALQPKGISANEAVALVVPINTSYTVLVEKAQLQKGQKVLIHGASGAVGSGMTQFAKALGAHVIATVPASGIELAKQLGADEIIDYKKQDFSKLVSEVDVVVDPIGGDTQRKSFDVLKKGGKLISIVSPPPAELAQKYGVTAEFISAAPATAKLEYGKKLVEENKLKAHIAKVMKLEQAAQAQDMLSAGGLNGKLVLEIH